MAPSQNQSDLRPDPRPDPGERFGWHPEPELIGYDDPARSRAAVEALGAAAWTAGVAYLYDEAFRRAMGEPAGYAALRRAFYGSAADGSVLAPAAAPDGPTPSAELIAEFTTAPGPAQPERLPPSGPQLLHAAAPG